MNFNAIDIVIVIAVLVGLVNGYRRGFGLSLAGYLGMLAGIVAGAYFAPDLLDRIGIADTLARQAGTLLLILLGSSIGGSIGFRLAGPLRRRLAATPLLGGLDSLFGAALAAAVTLVIAWLLAFTFARGPSPELAGAIQRSRIVEAIDAAAPEPPAFVARAQQALAGTSLPSIFTGLEPRISSPVEPSAASAATPGVRSAAAATLKIQGRGCGGVSTGSGFVAAPELVVTNAHVVSGTGRTTVSTSEGRSRPATVVFFDPDQDLAVLRVPGLDLAPLVPGEAREGSRGAVIGYPGGGPLTISPAVLQRRLSARGRDIYNDDIVLRDIWSVDALVRPGNSGGPLVDEAGRYLGVIFGGSVTDRDQAYALAGDEIAPRVREAVAVETAINTSRLPCSR